MPRAPWIGRPARCATAVSRCARLLARTGAGLEPGSSPYPGPLTGSNLVPALMRRGGGPRARARGRGRGGGRPTIDLANEELDRAGAHLLGRDQDGVQRRLRLLGHLVGAD